MNVLNLVVVEDHDDLRMIMVDCLSGLGHHVVGVDSAEAFDEHVSQHPVDLAVLDVNLPGEDGLSLCARIRKASHHMGIVMLTARNSASDHVKGYSSGADIYLDKPTSNEELIAAINSLARRMTPRRPNEFELQAAQLSLQGPLGHVQLTEAEVRVLRGLALSPNRRMPYWQLMDALELANDEAGKSAMEVRIVRLRKKLLEVGFPKPGIQSLYRFGYQLLVDVSII